MCPGKVMVAAEVDHWHNHNDVHPSPVATGIPPRRWLLIRSVPTFPPLRHELG
jgi:hypothetical protein